jgi:hypothetical protein
MHLLRLNLFSWKISLTSRHWTGSFRERTLVRIAAAYPERLQSCAVAHGTRSRPDMKSEHKDVNPLIPPSGNGCVDCLASGGWWLHLRRCVQCGHVGCCDSSPSQHASKHFHATGHTVAASFEPGETWFYDFRTRKCSRARDSLSRAGTQRVKRYRVPLGKFRQTGRCVCTRHPQPLEVRPHAACDGGQRDDDPD